MTISMANWRNMKQILLLASPLIVYIFNILSETILANDKLWQWHTHLVWKQIHIFVNNSKYVTNILLYTKGASIWSNIC